LEGGTAGKSGVLAHKRTQGGSQVRTEAEKRGTASSRLDKTVPNFASGKQKQFRNIRGDGGREPQYQKGENRILERGQNKTLQP